jgi:hypothetical protein
MISPRALKRGIGQGLLVLLALMPFHAFASVWLGHLFGHQSLIQSWKEVLLAILTLMGILLAIRDTESRERLRSWPIYAIATFGIIAILVTLVQWPGATAAIFGAKIDFEFMLAFALAAMVATPKLVRAAIITILVSSTIVFAFSIAQVFFLPKDFLAQFGYGPTTIMPFQFLGDWTGPFRFSSTLGGPNQLGTFTLLPIALAISVSVRRRYWWLLTIVPAGLISLFSTYSRGAWLGALVTAITLALILGGRRYRAPLLAAFALLALVATAAISQLARHSGRISSYIFHTGTKSDALHLQSLTTGLDSSIAKPLGHGLGTAGPAVFHSGTGHIIENYYLQLSYETGFLGLGIFVVIIITLGYELARNASRNALAPAALAALAGVSLTSVFLPAWTDSSTALILWIAAGIALCRTPDHYHV